MHKRNGHHRCALHRNATYLALVLMGLLLSACAQIPADIEQLIAVATAQPAAMEAVTVDATEPAATESAEMDAPTETATEVPAISATQSPTPVATAASAAELMLPTPTQEANTPAFVLPTPTPRATLVTTESESATATITSAVALTETSELTGSASVSDAVPVLVLPTATVRPLPAASETATPTPAAPMARVVNSINVRSGPGTTYPVIAVLSADARVEIVGRNATTDWLQVVYAQGGTGWLSAPLVEIEGDAASIGLVTEIPTPPPTATPAPATATPSAPAEVAPVEAATATPLPAAPTTGQSEFRVIDKRLWDVYENGGYLDGPSVTCGEKRQLVVTVLDAAGNRLNGVAVQAQYGAREIFYTGDGKGDGNVEFVLGGGQDVKVIRDNDGSEAISEMATGLATHPDGIAVDQLIQARYCSDAESCQRFIDAPGCFGHFSWTVTFQRNR